MENQTMSPQARKRFILIFITVMVLLTAAFFVALRVINNNQEKRKELTLALPESITKIFDSRHKDLQPTTADNPVQDVNFGKYLYFSSRHAELSDGRFFSHTYDESINKKLGTDLYYGIEDLDGLVFNTDGAEIVGYYYSDNAFSKSHNERPSNKRAFRNYKVIHFMTLPDFVIIRQDTLWGGEPPASIKSTDSAGVGSAVKNKDIVDAVQRAIR